MLIWLHEPGLEVPGDVVDRVVSIVESWLVRRQLLRRSIGDMGRIVADVIRAHERTPPTDANWLAASRHICRGST